MMAVDEVDASTRLANLITGPGEDVYRTVDLLSIAHAMGDTERKLAEYENDETRRRRHDAYKIRRLKTFAQLVRNFFTSDSAGHARYLKEQAESALRDAERGEPKQKGRFRG